jgi:hypothetical protein
LDTSKIPALDFHDAVLVSIDFTWAQQRCSLLLHPVSPSRISRRLVFEGVTLFRAPQEMPWGPSVSINTLTFVDDNVRIEMQSGDVIEIVAKSVAYHVL